MSTRVQAPEALPEDELDRSLRPRRLEDFVGQEALKDQLAVSIAAAVARGEALDHVLLAGPPGLGKTSLAQILAAELEVPFVQTAGPALERKGDVAAFLTALEPRSVFFVDEIHRLAVRSASIWARSTARRRSRSASSCRASISFLISRAKSSTTAERHLIARCAANRY